MKTKLKEKGINLRQLLNDGKKYIKTLSVKQLDILIREARNIYYGSGKEFIPDTVYDYLEDELRSRNPNHPTLKTAGGAKQPKGSKKIVLPYPLPSLGKIKPDSGFEKWVSTHPGPYVITDKLDGISLEIICDGENYTLYTRGKDGVEGKDVSFAIKYLDLPKPKKFSVRAEAKIPRNIFKNIYTEDFANPRNMTSGLFNPTTKVPSKHLKNIHITAYELLSSNKKQSTQLKKLKSLGFNIVTYKLSKIITAKELQNYYEQRKKESKYDIDGLVISQDIEYKRTKDIPKHSVAFKVNLDSEKLLVEVIDIEWEASKKGTLKPVLLIQELSTKSKKRLKSKGV